MKGSTRARRGARGKGPAGRRVSTFLAMRVPETTHNDLVVHKGRAGKMTIGKGAGLVAAEEAIACRMGPLVKLTGGDPLRGPLELEVKWVWKADENHPAGAPKTTKPDMSNLLKTLEDVLCRVGVIEDDRLIVSEHLLKGYGEHSGIRVSVRELAGYGGDKTARK